MLPFFVRRRHRRILETCRIGDRHWRKAVEGRPIFRRLGASQGELLRDLSSIFLAEKDFHEPPGADVPEEIRILIAAYACLPILELGIRWYDDWSSLILTPREYRVEKREVDDSGVVHEYSDRAAGEVLELGPVVLSVSDVLDAGGGYNVVIHEMAHKIDRRNGALDGMPPLEGRIDPDLWRRTFSQAFDSLTTSADSRRPGRSLLQGRLDSYATQDPVEFFAVMCEYFFDRPHRLLRVFPGVYRLLAAFFLQDPAQGGEDKGRSPGAGA